MLQNNPSPENISQVLASIEGIQRAEVSPFFYTRLVTRLNNARASYWEKISLVLSRPSVAFLCVSLVILLNLFAVFSHTRTLNAYQPDIVSSDDYTLVSNSNYDIENVKP